MERVVSLTKKAFSKEFMKLIPKVTELSDALWFLFRLGGSANSDVIVARFPNFKQDINSLIASDILETKEDLISFTEEFEERLLNKDITKLTASDISSVLLENYHDKLMENFKFDSFIDPLSTVLASIILSSSLKQPAFMSRIIRVTDNLFGETKSQYSVLADSKPVLDNFLNKSLDLVEFTGHYVTLTDKAKQLVERDEELSQFYSKNENEKTE